MLSMFSKRRRAFTRIEERLAHQICRLIRVKRPPHFANSTRRTVRFLAGPSLLLMDTWFSWG
jgi:hypothetical protein